MKKSFPVFINLIVVAALLATNATGEVGGRVITADAYNGLDQLTSVTSGTQTTAYQYDPVGFMTRVDFPNGVNTVYTPNERNQLTNVTSKLGNTVLQSFDYQLDNAGNRKQVTEAGGGTIIWGYDNLYRLTSETRGSTTTEFHYDLAGNRDWVKVNGVTTTMYTYNVLDQLKTAGTVTYDYDARGNQVKITNGSNVTNYTYNAADQLTNVTATGINATYAYDADGHRVKQTLGSTVTNYLWDEASPYGDVVFEYNGSGSMLASYVLGGTGLISQTRGATTNYFLQDGQNSTRALTSSTGTVTDTYSYTAFGESIATTGTTVNPYRYTGQQLDTSTGLYSLRARYYNPALGRFLSQDTYPYNFSNPVELNRYIFVANDPINRMDPTGRFAQSVGGYIPSLQNVARIAAIGTITFVIGVVVIGAIDSLFPHVQPKIWEKEKAPPVSVPPIESLDDINRREQWRQYCQFQANCQPKPQPTQVGTKIPPIYSTPDDDDCDAPPWTDWTPPYKITGDATGQVHHIATDKHKSYWEPIFVVMFDKASLSVDTKWNKIRLAGHQSRRHEDEYHQYVFNNLSTATAGLKCNPYRHALQERLWQFKQDLMTPGSYIRQLLGLQP